MGISPRKNPTVTVGEVYDWSGIMVTGTPLTVIHPHDATGSTGNTERCGGTLRV